MRRYLEAEDGGDQMTTVQTETQDEMTLRTQMEFNNYLFLHPLPSKCMFTGWKHEPDDLEGERGFVSQIGGKLDNGKIAFVCLPEMTHGITSNADTIPVGTKRIFRGDATVELIAPAVELLRFYLDPFNPRYMSRPAS